MLFSKVILSLRMKLRSGYEYGNSEYSDSETMMPVIDDFDDSNNNSFQMIANTDSITPSPIVRVKNLFGRFVPAINGSSLNRVKNLFNRVVPAILYGFKSIVIITPTVLGVVGGLLSFFHHFKYNSDQVKLFVEIDGELFSLTKTNQTV